MNPPIRTLPADVYDALEFSVEAFGPIGRGQAGRWREGEPVCVIGHAWAIDDPDTADPNASPKALQCLLERHQVHSLLNDTIIAREEMVSWAEFCRRANIVRGES